MTPCVSCLHEVSPKPQLFASSGPQALSNEG